MYLFRNKVSFYGEKLLALRPTPSLEEHPLSAVRDCLFNLFAATLRIRGRTSIRNLRTRQAVVTGTHLSYSVHPRTPIFNFNGLRSLRSVHKRRECGQAVYDVISYQLHFWNSSY